MSYYLSELLACMCIFESMENEDKFLQLSILKENLLSVQQHYHKTLEPVDAEVKLQMDKPLLLEWYKIKEKGKAQTTQRLVNIFNNVCNDEELRYKLKPLTNSSLTLKTCISLESKLVEKVFKTAYKQCHCTLLYFPGTQRKCWIRLNLL